MNISTLQLKSALRIILVLTFCVQCYAITHMFAVVATAKDVPKNVNTKNKIYVDKECKDIFKIGIEDYDKYSDRKNPLVEYWYDISGKARVHYRNIITGGQLREKMYLFEQQFAKHGNQADIRWILSAPDGTINVKNNHFPEASPENESQRQLIQSFAHLAEFQVRHFLKEPKVLKRYCRFMIWQGSISTEISLIRLRQITRDGLIMKSKPNSGEYWWYARSFVVWAYLTGRADLLADADPLKLDEIARNYFEWYENEGCYLRPRKNSLGWEIDLQAKRLNDQYLPFIELGTLPKLPSPPEFPFDNWEGPPPPPKIFIFELN